MYFSAKRQSVNRTAERLHNETLGLLTFSETFFFHECDVQQLQITKHLLLSSPKRTVKAGREHAVKL